MCRSMVNIQSPTTEIRRGKKKKKERKKQDENMVALLHRATITRLPLVQLYVITTLFHLCGPFVLCIVILQSYDRRHAPPPGYATGSSGAHMQTLKKLCPLLFSPPLGKCKNLHLKVKTFYSLVKTMAST